MKNKVFGILAGMVAFAAISSASTVACTPNGAVVVGPGSVSSVGCGPLTFSNFVAFQVSPPGGSPTVDMAASPLSSYDTVTGIVNLTFDPNFIVPAGTIEDIYFYFTVAGPVNQVDLSVAGSVGTGITEVYCSSPIPMSGQGINVCPGGSTVSGSISAGSNQSNPGTPFGTTVSTLYIYKDIQLNNSNGTTQGELSSFSQSFHTSAVPEPMTLSMMGIGLLGLGLMRRRQQGKK